MLTTRRLFTTIFFVALFVMTAREIGDPDFWWHLSAGRYIVETQSVPHVDVFSFTNAGHPWVAHEWLSEVFIYAIFTLGSFPLLILAFSAIITLAFVFVYIRCDGKPYLAAFTLLLAAITTAPTWGARPQMLSLLLTSVFLWALDNSAVSASKAKLNAVWLLPSLMILWVNLHSGYALGIVIVGVYLFGEIISRIMHHELRQAFPTQLTTIFLLCLVAVLFNPNGATMYIYPFETLTSRAMQAYIQEWFSPDFHQIEFQPFAWLLLATLASIAMSSKRASLTQTILLAGFGYAALRSARHIPLFAIIAAPILAEHLTQIFVPQGWLKVINESNRRMTQGMAIVNWVLLTLVVIAGGARIAMALSNQDAIERAKFPVAAVDFIRAQKIDGALYNSYAWGGYLIWQFYPNRRVFIDGRADVYGDAFIEDVYLKAYRGGADWREPLDRYNIRTVIVELDAPLVAQLLRDPMWKKMYEDKLAIIYSR